jgi:hypothetical protein
MLPLARYSSRGHTPRLGFCSEARGWSQFGPVLSSWRVTQLASSCLASYPAPGTERKACVNDYERGGKEKNLWLATGHRRRYVYH